MTRPDGQDEDQLLAYLRGQTDEDSMKRIDAQADTDPVFRAELALMRGLKCALAEEDGAAPDGWDRLSAEIERTRPANSTERPLWRIAALFLGAAILLQSAFLVSTSRDEPLFRTVSEEPALPSLAIAFRTDATLAEVEALLGTAGARIVDGPSALGLYWVAFENDAARQSGQITLEASSLVSLVAED
ncbi:hypothetical protein [uncultured Tateyamaria sp.]|uniref:hypothetical protein n=1 Tax=uncultured Tateyamaria sp. TaxID=455651 RepID=UPI0026039901|nr:hypothetical protein [uncultured Tateyamaria sp.]